MAFPQRGPQHVEVTVVTNPEGELAVLLQLPNGYLVCKPDDARHLAGMLAETADEVDAQACSIPASRRTRVWL